MGGKSMRSLKEIVDDYYRIEAELDQYYEEKIRPEINKCKNKDEFLDLRQEISNQCDDGTIIRQVPSPLNVRLLLTSHSKGLNE
jgi:hypothetical protein